MKLHSNGKSLRAERGGRKNIMGSATQAIRSEAAKPEIDEVGKPVEGGLLKKDVAKRSIFNLDTMSRESKEVPYEYVEPQTHEDLAKLYNSEDLLEAGKLYAKRKAWQDARGQIEGPDAAAVTKFISSFRTLPMYAAIKDRAEQTSQIVTFIKATPFLMEQLKQMVADANKPATSEPEEEE